MPGPVFLSGETISLHPIDEEDLPFLQQVINDPEVWLTLGRATPATMQDEVDFFEEVVHADDQEHLLISAHDDPIGIIGLHDINHIWGVGELGYFLGAEHHGKGYGTEAVELFTDWVFDHLRLEKLTALVLPMNPASARVLEKNGYVEEGRLSDYAFVDGTRRDISIYGRTADD